MLQFDLILQVALSMLYVRSAKSGELVPLNTLAKVMTDLGPANVSHTGQLPSVTMSFNLKEGPELTWEVPAGAAPAVGPGPRPHGTV
jgi:multidrug efflux pump subunit AcrB